MKTTNNIFSFHRFRQLVQYHIVIDRKSTLLSIMGYCIGIILMLFIGQVSGNNHRNWNSLSYYKTFLFFYFIFGIIYSAKSFKWLRSKEARFSYLMIPSSSFEKFIIELIFKIFGFILLVPILFWLLANIEGSIFHMFDPDFVNFQFSLLDFYYNSVIGGKTNFWEIWLTINLIFLIFIIPFTGATYFKKSPLSKTLLSLVSIIGILFVFGFILVKIFGLKHYKPVHILFMSTNYQNLIVGGIAIFITNLTALCIAFFNVKEKEV